LEQVFWHAAAARLAISKSFARTAHSAGNVRANAVPMLGSSTPTAQHARDGDLRRLVQRASRGDQRAWDQLVCRYEHLLAAVARSHGLSEADAADVSQNTWMRLFMNLSKINDITRLGGWLTTTAQRESLRMLRQRPRYELDGDQALLAVPHYDRTEEDLITAERNAALRNVVARLPERDRSLLWLLNTEPPRSYAEIGTALGMRIGSIGPTRARSLRRLCMAAERDAELLL
jgi:RNA polymerase sigma factor (sigma-70 family)